MTVAILCSGQGNQHPDMFALTAEAPEAAPIFEAATHALGRDPRDLVRSGDEAALHTNVAGQILCCAQALAAYATLRDVIGSRVVLAGYSAGELASWGCAEVFSPETVFELTIRRATMMNEASGPNDGLAFVRGLAREVLDALCQRHATWIAIVNPDNLFVIGGDVDDLRALCDAAMRSGGAKTGLLKVAVASHTPRLAAAAPRFREALAGAKPIGRLKPGLRLLSGVDGASVPSIARGLDKLAEQISSAIEWAACLEACVEADADVVLELGPGNALATMAAVAYPHLPIRALDDFRALSGLKAWLTARVDGSDRHHG